MEPFTPFTAPLLATAVVLFLLVLLMDRRAPKGDVFYVDPDALSATREAEIDPRSVALSDKQVFLESKVLGLERKVTMAHERIEELERRETGASVRKKARRVSSKKRGGT